MKILKKFCIKPGSKKTLRNLNQEGKKMNPFKQNWSQTLNQNLNYSFELRVVLYDLQ